MSENGSTLEGRLRWAIEDHQPQEGRQRGVRLFQRKMEERDEELRQGGEKLLGTALSSIQNYLSGDSEPSLSWIEEAGRVLGVRPVWLAYGIGQPTKPDALAEEEAEAANVETDGTTAARDPDGSVVGRRWRQEYASTLERVLGGRVPPLARAAIAHHWRRLDVTASGSPATRMDPDELLELLAQTIAAPLEEAGVDFSDLRAEDRTDYVLKVVDPVAFAWNQQLRTQVAAWIEESAIIHRGEDDDG